MVFHFIIQVHEKNGNPKTSVETAEGFKNPESDKTVHGRQVLPPLSDTNQAEVAQGNTQDHSEQRDWAVSEQTAESEVEIETGRDKMATQAKRRARPGDIDPQISLVSNTTSSSNSEGKDFAGKHNKA